MNSLFLFFVASSMLTAGSIIAFIGMVMMLAGIQTVWWLFL